MPENSIRERRIRAGITGYPLCKKAGVARSRLSDIEQGHVVPSADELQRLNAALDELIECSIDTETLSTKERVLCGALVRALRREDYWFGFFLDYILDSEGRTPGEIGPAQVQRWLAYCAAHSGVPLEEIGA